MLSYILYAVVWLLFGVLLWQAFKLFGLTRRFAVRFAVPITLFGIILGPFTAFAQEGTVPTVFGVPLPMIVLIWLALVDFAKRVAEAVPGTREDRVISVIDAITRKVVDFLAGNYGMGADPYLIRKNPPPADTQ